MKITRECFKSVPPTLEEYNPFIVAEDVPLLILTNIANDLIKIGDFAYDTEDEVFAVRDGIEAPDYSSIYSEEFCSAIYWVGLLKGVALDELEINEIADGIRKYVLANKEAAEFTGELPYKVAVR